MSNDPYSGVEQSIGVRGQELLSAIAEAGTAGRRAFDAARAQVNLDSYTRAATIAMQPGAGTAPAGAVAAAGAPLADQNAVAQQALGASQAGFEQSQTLMRQGAEQNIAQQTAAVPMYRERTGRILQRLAAERAERERARAEEQSFRREQMAVQRELAQMELEGARLQANGAGAITPTELRAQQDQAWQEEDRARAAEDRRYEAKQNAVDRLKNLWGEDSNSLAAVREVIENGKSIDDVLKKYKTPSGKKLNRQAIEGAVRRINEAGR